MPILDTKLSLNCCQQWSVVSGHCITDTDTDSLPPSGPHAVLSWKWVTSWGCLAQGKGMYPLVNMNYLVGWLRILLQHNG